MGRFPLEVSVLGQVANYLVFTMIITISFFSYNYDFRKWAGQVCQTLHRGGEFLHFLRGGAFLYMGGAELYVARF